MAHLADLTNIDSTLFEYPQEPTCTKKMILGGLAVAGVIVLIGSAIAAWQLYGHFQNPVVFAVLATDILAAGAIFAAVFYWPKQADAAEVSEPVENKASWKPLASSILPSIEDAKHLNVPCEGCTIFELTADIEGSVFLQAGKCVLVLGKVDKLSLHPENPLIADFDRDDLRDCSKVNYNSGTGLLTLYRAYGSWKFQIKKETATTGQQGQKLVKPLFLDPSSASVNSPSPVKLGTKAFPTSKCEGAEVYQFKDSRLKDYANTKSWAIVMGTQFTGKCGTDNPPILYFKTDDGKPYLSPADGYYPCMIKWDAVNKSLEIMWDHPHKNYYTLSYQPDTTNIEIGQDGQKFMFAGYDKNQRARIEQAQKQKVSQHEPKFGSIINYYEGSGGIEVRNVSGKWEHCDIDRGQAIILGKLGDRPSFHQDNPPIICFRDKSNSDKLLLYPNNCSSSIERITYNDYNDGYLRCFHYGGLVLKYKLEPIDIEQNSQKFMLAVFRSTDTIW